VAGAASTGTSSPKAPTAATAPAAKQQPEGGQGPAPVHRRHAGVLAAKTIGIKPADLRKELLAGKTIAAIATEHGVTTAEGHRHLDRRGPTPRSRRP